MTLLVRLPNWVGDVCMALPALRGLSGQGLALRLFGRPWAADLLAGHPWPVDGLPAGVRAGAAAVRACGIDRGLLFPNSFSSAWTFRLGGVRAIGYRGDGRSLLLARAVARASGAHEVESFWALACEAARWLDRPPLAPAPPGRLGLQLAPAHRQQARDALAAAGVATGESAAPLVVLAPLAAGTIRGVSKVWPHFAALSRHLAHAGACVVCCPGPNEARSAAEAVPAAVQLPGLRLGAYAAVCAQAALVVANDSGPMHLAAAVDASVLGVFGTGDPGRTRPWSPGAQWIGGPPSGWPSLQAVCSRVDRMLAERRVG